MIQLLMEQTHTCPHCSISVTGKDEISIFFGWRKSFRYTKEPSYRMIPQSWCVKCRSQVIRYE